MLNLQGTVLNTERLRQVIVSRKYLNDINDNFNQDVTKYMYPAPFNSLEITKQYIDDSVMMVNAGSELQLVILDKKTGEFLGCSGLHRVHSFFPEIGIWLKTSAHHKGYGREAVEAIILWALQNIDFTFIMYPADVRNIPSCKIPEFFGGRIFRHFEIENESHFNLRVAEYRIYKEDLLKLAFDFNSKHIN